MHELAIAESVAAIVSEHAAGRRVLAVEMRIGHLRQVVPSALEFSFELVTMDTELEGARLVIEAVPPGGRCRACGADGDLGETFPLQCPRCGGLDVELLRGEELLVDALEVDDALVTTGGADGSR